MTHFLNKTTSALLSMLLVAAAGPVVAGAETVAASAKAAAELSVGDALPPLVLHDQHGGEAQVDASTKLLLLTRDMGSGGLVKEALATDGNDILAKAKAVYVSDVSGMPGLVRSAFALPALRKRSYAVILDEKGDATATLPWRAGKASILTLEGGRITAIVFASTSADVKAALAP